MIIHTNTNDVGQVLFDQHNEGYGSPTVQVGGGDDTPPEAPPEGTIAVRLEYEDRD